MYAIKVKDSERLTNKGNSEFAHSPRMLIDLGHGGSVLLRRVEHPNDELRRAGWNLEHVTHALDVGGIVELLFDPLLLKDELVSMTKRVTPSDQTSPL